MTNISIDGTCQNAKNISDKKSTQFGNIPKKKYAPRNSILTDLYENEHISTVYNLFLLILFCLYANSTANDFLYKGGLTMGFSLAIKSFQNIHYALLVWSGMFLSSFLPYYGLAGWALARVQLGPKSIATKIWDYLAIVMVIIYYVVFLIAFPTLIRSLSFQIGESFALLCDAVRILIKCYAFIRSNVPRVLAYKHHVEDQFLYPTVKQFLYFSFIPATIYQDEYPRTKKTNWNNVVLYITEFLACVLLMSSIVEIFFINALEEYGTRKYELRDLMLLVLKNCLGGLTMFFAEFYILQHVWMNFFAELLTFSDRMFYKDWWTSDNYDRYYRNWNVVVHDWIYVYIYKDLCKLVNSKNKKPLKVLVFFISAVFHEYILALSFGFFLPILFILFFVIGVPVSYLRFKSKRFGNFLLLFSLAFGMSVNMCSYTMEYYCRANTQTNDSNWNDLLIPKLFNCYFLNT